MPGLNPSLSEHPHRRYNPLTGEWVLVSPHRAKRPWHGQDEETKPPTLSVYDVQCSLCPGNTRASGLSNPDYNSTFVFDNDFAALKPEASDVSEVEQGLFQVKKASGLSRVICYSPDHSKRLPQLTHDEIAAVIHTWNEQLCELGRDYLWVQVFENQGQMMGCSQPHPHGQIWANDFLPTLIEKKDQQLKKYHLAKGSNLLLDYALAESSRGERTVLETEHWIVIVPFWAAWPFETMVLPKQLASRMSDLSTLAKLDLAKVLKCLTTRYDNLFQCNFPYSMGWHYAPFFKDDRAIDYWQLHALFYPPLLRSASVRKFMVGYEMLSESQRDLTPEQAAERLRTLSDRHYTSH